MEQKIRSHKHIHERIRKKHPEAFKKSKSISRLKYPKLIIFVLCIIFAYVIFKNPKVVELISHLESLNYIGILIAGFFIAFGFISPFGIGFLTAVNPEKIFLAAMMGGFGAAIGDFIIFKTIKFSFLNEFNEIKKSKTAKFIEEVVDKNTPVKIHHYLLYVFAGFFIATPLPDEIGVSLLAGLTTIKLKILLTIAFVLHTIGIFIILLTSA